MKLQSFLIIIVRLVFLSLITKGVICQRLPRDVVPTHYSITLKPNIDDDYFTGKVTIYVKLQRAQQEIRLNSALLNISEIFVNFRKTNSFFLNLQTQELSIVQNEGLPPGEHVIHIKYSGFMRHKDGNGLARETYKFGKKSGFLVVSEFEATHARKAFPCFDEPFFKSKFNVRLITPNETFRALSNMPEIGKIVTSSGVIYDFATTVPISTYLVAFAVTDYTYSEIIFEDNGKNIPIRVNTFNASFVNNALALRTSVKALKFYTNYTGISYPLPKLDFIEYERTSASFATENWGLVTSRQGLLSGGRYENKTIEIILFHELGHFWFGNLVTNDWWDDLWLQEGFATYFSYKALCNLKKKHCELEKFYSDFHTELYQLFKSATTLNTKSQIKNVKTPEDIEKTFSPLQYDKGAALLYMINNVLGENAFQTVVQAFLKKFQYKTATSNDLITTIEEIVPDVNNIRPFIESYLYQEQLPLINVVGGNGSYTLTQTSTSTSPESARLKWTIPITYSTDLENSSKITWFDRDMEKLTILVPGAKWFKLNYKEFGLYKVNYTEAIWANFIQFIQEIPSSSQKHLISEVVYSYEFGYIGCDVGLKLLKNVKSLRDSSTQFFLVFLRTDLECMNEFSLFLEYTYKLFSNLGYMARKYVKDAELNCEERNKNEKRIERCAKWIRDNLKD